ncbi:rhodanese-like domain-containing protein [Stutzerimonas stutzeri]|uniref:rhodanese-like domain-containing protein n=1 Tax=Stutzerimonas stutzeri TaxID=316 RepID=UPI001C2E7353|nr:rhodanese-like domain-containing protein [Stutzerimonas stutzeri]
MHRVFWLLMAMTGTVLGGQIDRPAALSALERPDVVLLDVRTAEEYADGALPGATRIETQDLAARIASVAPDKDAPVVVYCRSGRRSSAAQDLLQDMGYRQVINAGGYDDLKDVVPSR